MGVRPAETTGVGLIDETTWASGVQFAHADRSWVPGSFRYQDFGAKPRVRKSGGWFLSIPSTRNHGTE